MELRHQAPPERSDPSSDSSVPLLATYCLFPVSRRPHESWPSPAAQCARCFLGNAPTNKRPGKWLHGQSGLSWSPVSNHAESTRHAQPEDSTHWMKHEAVPLPVI